MRLERGLNEVGRREFLILRMESPLPKKFYGVVRCRHNDGNDVQGRGNDVVMSATAAGIAFKTKA